MSDRLDANHLYVQYRFPPSTPLPPSVDQAGSAVHRGENSIVVEIWGWESTASLWNERQAEFDQSLAAALDATRRAGLSQSELERLGGVLEVRLVLVPDVGVAGLVLGARELGALSALGADLYVESWGTGDHPVER